MLALAVIAVPAWAEEFDGVVVYVSDGDTLTVLDREKKRIRIRLQGIDAPEKGHKGVAGQPYGDKARKALIAASKGKAATVFWQDHDQYGRIVGRVVVDGVDLGLEQLRAGFAWVHVDFIAGVPESQRSRYLSAELDARAARLGLWEEPEPKQPWVWREEQRRLLQAAQQAARQQAKQDDDGE